MEEVFYIFSDDDFFNFFGEYDDVIVVEFILILDVDMLFYVLEDLDMLFI